MLRDQLRGCFGAERPPRGRSAGSGTSGSERASRSDLPSKDGRSLKEFIPESGRGEFTRLEAKPASAGAERYGVFEKRKNPQEGIDNSGFDSVPNAVALQGLDIKELRAKSPVADSLDRGSIVLGDRPTLGRLFAAVPEPQPVPVAGAAASGVVDARGRKDEAGLAGEIDSWTAAATIRGSGQTGRRNRLQHCDCRGQRIGRGPVTSTSRP